MTNPFIVPRLSRRSVLAGGAAGALGVSLAGGTRLPAHAAQGDSVTSGSITLTDIGRGVIAVTDAQGIRRTTLSGLFLNPVGRTDGGTSTVVQSASGPSLVVRYTFVPSESQPEVQVVGTFTALDHRVQVRWDITTEAHVDPGLVMMYRSLSPGAGPETLVSTTRWDTDPRGGVPFEVPGPGLYQIDYSDGSHGFWVFSGKSNPSWRDAWSIHNPGEAVGTNRWVVKADFVIGNVTADAVAASFSNQTLSAKVSTGKRVNMWYGDSATPELTLTASNLGAERAVTMRWFVKDYYGRNIVSGSQVQKMAAASTITKKVKVPALGRGVYFVEVRVASGRDKALARTNLGVLPPHTFPKGTTMFGLAAWFTDYPGTEHSDLLKLIDRLGVSQTRQDQFTRAEADSIGLLMNIHPHTSVGEHDNDMLEWTDGWIDRGLVAGSRFAEVANEWNGVGGYLSGTSAQGYVDTYLKPWRKRLSERAPSIGIACQGSAGMDYVWTEKFHEAGGWPLIDAFSMHPGRGNFTADYAPPVEEWTLGSNGEYWNFLGAVRKGREMINEYGDKHYILSEVYACTKPNFWWSDTYRTSAENTLLQCALAMTEGVDALYQYQLNDTTWWNQGGANYDDREFHFGLMMRDMSPKPMAIAFATAAEHLSDATFKRWLPFDDSDVKGLEFSTPRGPLAIIWSREEGYILNADHDTVSPPDDPSFYPMPEPWVDAWSAKKTLRLKAAKASVKALDCIGLPVAVKVQGRQASIEIDGAPRLYYGLDLTKLR